MPFVAALSNSFSAAFTAVSLAATSVLIAVSALVRNVFKRDFTD